MTSPGTRSSGWKLVVGLLVIAVVAVAAVVLLSVWRDRQSDTVSPQGPQTDTPAAVVPPIPATPALPIAPPVLTRGDLVAAAASAASAYSAGDAAPSEPGLLVGRRFRVVLAFGCFGPRAIDAEPSAYWEYGADRETVRISVRPEPWTDSAFVREIAGAPAEAPDAVEGHWIPRPWLASEGCPAVREDPLQAAPPAPSPQTIGLAVFHEADESRVGRRSGRPYEATVRAPAEGSNGRGYRLVLEGRIGAFADGSAIRCRSASSEQRPVCLFNVELERVAIRDPADAVLGEWTS